MSVVETSEIFSIEMCQKNPNKLFVFGENQAQAGKKMMGGGQAVIRPCKNAVGFCTLEAIGKPWTDEHFSLNCVQIEKDISKVRIEFVNGKYDNIVFPRYGLGTGRAFMIQRCPRIFFYMCTRLLDEFGFNNIEYLTVPKF